MREPHFSAVTAARHLSIGRNTRWRAGRRATAALEFALAAPVLIIMIGGVHDIGLGEYTRSVMANAVSSGSQYAYLNGNAGVAAGAATTTFQNNVSAVVQNVASLPSTLTVTVAGPTGYCVTGSTPTKTSTAFGGACSDGSTAGEYVTITATYTNNGLMAGFRSAATSTITETAMVMVR